MRKTLGLLLLLSLPARTLAFHASDSPQDAAKNVQPDTLQAQASAGTLTNKDIQDMIKAGLSSDIIIAKIKGTASNFDTSPATLQEMKKAGVPDAVVLAMVQASIPAAATTASAGNLRATVETKIPDGTAVEIVLQETLSAKSLKEGSIVDFTVVQPVQVNGVTVIEKGAPAKARITRAKKAGYWGRAGKLEWAMQDVLGVDGSRIPLRFTQRTTGDSKGGTVATGAVVTGIFFPPAALLWGLKKGKEASVPAGQRYNVVVHGDTVARGVPTVASAN
jgi:hypothetical protein